MGSVHHGKDDLHTNRKFSMRQPTLSDNGFEKFCRKTYKDQFLDEMEVITPWKELTGGIEPFYPQPEGLAYAPSALNGCYAFTFCSTGSTCPIRQSRRLCTILVPCASLSVLTSAYRIAFDREQLMKLTHL